MGFCPGTLSWFLTSKSGPAGNQHLLRNWPPNQNVWFQRNIYAAVISIIFYQTKAQTSTCYQEPRIRLVEKVRQRFQNQVVCWIAATEERLQTDPEHQDGPSVMVSGLVCHTF